MSGVFATHRWQRPIHYHHTVVSATLVKAGSHRVVPMDVEEVRNSDGSDTQDCELNAAKRLISRVRQEHPQLPLIIGGDDLLRLSRFKLAGLRRQETPRPPTLMP